ncbi:hypothetical protein [Rhodomicrobium lacus]|uniref:hypothetical protein n=1 Tax=Rhodomicrobium lacus TaxID=2498452 RepID=UPI0013DFA6B5|nr:hypothetical protein [Rhodomicrobium lacus]
MITALIWRARTAYWLRRLTGMQRLEAWRYAGALSYALAEFEPRTAVEIEMSYWEE